MIKVSSKFNLSCGPCLKIGNLIIFTIGTAGTQFTNKMQIATIDNSIIPKQVKRGTSFTSTPNIAVESYSNSYPFAISAEIYPEEKNTIILVGSNPEININFSGYCTLIYEI